MKKVLVLMAVGLVVLFVTDANAYFRITTADAGGADCELREEGPTTNRGTSTEIASRLYGSTSPTAWRDSAIYLKFGVGSITAADLAGNITVRTTIRNTNMASGRFQDTVGDIGPNTGWDYYVLDPTMAGADWSETGITPNTAPGASVDGDYSTKMTTDFLGSLNPGLTYLGQQLYDSSKMKSGRLVVGDAFDFTLSAGSALHSAILAAQGTGHQTLTIIMQMAHNWDNENTQWLNFNYLFNPKEMTTLNADPLSPWSGKKNDASNGFLFSPTLTNLPEPTTMTLLGLGILALLKKRS